MRLLTVVLVSHRPASNPKQGCSRQDRRDSLVVDAAATFHNGSPSSVNSAHSKNPQLSLPGTPPA